MKRSERVNFGTTTRDSYQKHKRDYSTHESEDIVVLKGPGTNRPRQQLERSHRINEIFAQRRQRLHRCKMRNRPVWSWIPFPFPFFPRKNSQCCATVFLLPPPPIHHLFNHNRSTIISASTVHVTKKKAVGVTSCASTLRCHTTVHGSNVSAWRNRPVSPQLSR